MKTPRLLAYLITVLCAGAASAAEESLNLPIQAVEEESELADLERLLSILDEQTEIATKTKLNADYVPGMVTVLHGSSLEAKGVRTVWEALALVPGIEISVETTGHRQVVVRGDGLNYLNGNTKILVNDVAMNMSLTGLANPVYNMPIEQVERIEVIRGPGSAIHGEYAYAGVINVITHKSNNRAHASVTSNGRGMGVSLAAGDSSKGSYAALNMSTWDYNGSDINSGNDTVYQLTLPSPPFPANLTDYSYAPGPINDVASASAADLTVVHEGFSFKLHHLADNYGDHYGVNLVLPPAKEEVIHNTFNSVEIGKSFRSSDSFMTEVKLSDTTQQTEVDYFLGQAELYLGSNNDSRHKHSYQERRRDVTVNGLWSSADKSNKLLVSANYSRIIPTYDYYTFVNFDPTTFLAVPGIVESPSPLTNDNRRTIKSLLFQDEFTYQNDITITAGIRRDDYNDAGTSTTPRIAAVWRLSDHHILKAQFAKAFRPPTLLNSAISPDIEPETIDTKEFGYIFKSNDFVMRFTGFYSNLKDLIAFDPTIPAFVNKEAGRLKGLEVEVEYQISHQLKLDANASYAKTEDAKTGMEFLGSSELLGNLGLAYKPLTNMMLSLQHRYVSGYSREETSVRDELDGYQLTNFTINWSNFLFKNMTARAGVNNLMDKTFKYPAPDGTYVNDFPYGERQWWAQLSYTF